MPKVILAPAIARWLSPEPTTRGEEAVMVTGATVREALDGVFARYPILRGYVVDEHGTLRHHVVAFVNNEPVRDKQTLAEPVLPDGEIYVFQALSGG